MPNFIYISTIATAFKSTPTAPQSYSTASQRFRLHAGTGIQAAAEDALGQRAAAADTGQQVRRRVRTRE